MRKQGEHLRNNRQSVMGYGKNAAADKTLKQVKELCNKSLFAFLKIIGRLLHSLWCRALGAF